MPATSKEALAQKAERRKKKRQAAKAVVRITLKKSDWPRYKIAARSMRGKLPDMSKQQLREMLAQAMRNTAGATDVDQTS